MIIKISSLVESLAETIDLVSSEVNNHHRRVACIASYIGEAYGMPHNNFENLVVASALHDVGGLTTQDRLGLLSFEENAGNHSEYGYMLLTKFAPFAHIAPIIRYHHAHWNNGAETGPDGEKIPLESRVIFLADRISVLMPPDFNLHHADGIKEKIAANSGTYFMPDLVDVFKTLSGSESFWLDARDAFSGPLFEAALARNLSLNTSDLLGLGRLYSQIIDFRSSFTATHSSGVAAVAEALAGFCSFSSEECVMIKIAGYLHDIGKLIVPETILEKPGLLTHDEYDRMRCHPYYTNRLLMGIQEFGTIRLWASMHHERIDGNGYPRHLPGSQLPLGARILAVADVFVAVTEDRPYRKGMGMEGALTVLAGMAKNGALDSEIVRILERNADWIDRMRRHEQEKARQEYGRFYSGGMQGKERRN